MAADNGSVKIYYNSGQSEDYALRSIRFELDDAGVALCTWNEPKSLNALSPNLVQETFIVLEHARRDAAIKVLVWTGAGRAWGSGASIGGNPVVHMPETARAEYLSRGMSWEGIEIGKETSRAFWVNLCLAFWDFPKISIAAVNGMAVGGGVNVALCNFHDFVFCSESTKFKYPFVSLGATPELSSSLLLPYLVGHAKAKELLLIGDWFSGEEAVRLGLANRLVSNDALVPEALALAKRFASEPNPMALTLGKQVINRHLRAGLEDVLDEEQRVIGHSLKAATSSKLKNAKKPSKL